MENASTKRNIVVIMCDQLRADFLHAYGADFIPTPNIDALASEGVVYDNAITASTVCGPARASFISGLNVSGHDMWTNPIPTNGRVEFFPERLRDAGYMTAAVGVYEHNPVENDYGYKYREVIVAEPEKNGYIKYIKSKYPDETQVYPEGENNRFKYPEEDFYDRWSTDRATEFIESYTKTGKAPDGTAPENDNAPFYLYCGFMSPHSPLIPPIEVAGSVDINKLPAVRLQQRPDEDIPAVELYRRAYLNDSVLLDDPHALDEERKLERLLYAELIVEVDNLVGKIVKSLKDNGVYDNTTIIFTTDHGSCENDYNMATKGPWPYKPQLFIPMIISNHPRLKKGTHCDALCGNLDVGATALDIAGDHKAFGVSRSMIGLAEGSVPEREVNLSEFCDSCKTLVDKRYTFTYYPFTGKTCLFDRIADPEEQTNLGGRKEYEGLEKKFLMQIMDILIVNKGVRMEAHDLSPDVYNGVLKTHPKFMDNFEVVYPLANWTQVDRIAKAGLDSTYNEFCKNCEVKYDIPGYFTEEKPKNL